jgi:predicted nuclease of predicted toxin-antitoxin system
MKLLFDQNLSPNLARRLEDLFPDSSHVFELGLDRAQDIEVREFAEKNDFVIVTKDSDYSDMSLLLGFPPKIVWIRRGNCSTRSIEEMLRERFEEISQLASDPYAGIIIIY